MNWWESVSLAPDTMKSPGKGAHLFNIGSVLLQLYGLSDALWIGDPHAYTVRHVLQRDEVDTDGALHAAKVAWRALAQLEMLLEG